MFNYCISNSTATTGICLAPIVQQVDIYDAPVPCQDVCKSTLKGNNPMYVENDKHIESNKINYLYNRLEAAYCAKIFSLPRQFGLTDDAAPTTAQELIDRIVAGKYMFKDEKKKDDAHAFYRPVENIRWRDPATKEDKAGYAAAEKVLLAVYQDARDTVAIGTPAEGLAAVKTVDAWTA